MRRPEGGDGPRLGFPTRMSHAGRAGTHAHGFVNPAVHRGSTVLFADCEGRRRSTEQRFDQVLTYGTAGGPTHHALEDVIAEIEGGTRSLIVGSGLAAIMVPMLACLKTGAHCLMPDSVYGPARSLAEGLMTGFGVTTTFYDPVIDAAGLRALLRPETRVLYLESPGSHSFEVQDVPALAAVAQAHGATVLMDNTWGIHHFQPFRHGVDISIQALTKYVGGHSDILLGSVTVATDAQWRRVRAAAGQLGQYASPDDCWLALRGVRTMPLRLRHQQESGIAVARWLAVQPQVARVLHPALPEHPGHAIWRRDFSGACSLFGVVFQPRYSDADIAAMIDGLSIFGIGASWGGFESLALPTTGFVTRSASPDFGGPAIRLHVGLEDAADLIADLQGGLAALPS